MCEKERKRKRARQRKRKFLIRNISAPAASVVHENSANNMLRNNKNFEIKLKDTYNINTNTLVYTERLSCEVGICICYMVDVSCLSTCVQTIFKDVICIFIPKEFMSRNCQYILTPF